MLSDFENVLDRLKIASRNGDKAMAFCPAHDDKYSPSLSVKAQEGKLLLNCFAGCTIEEIVAAVGLEMRDLFADGAGKVVPLRIKGVCIPPDGIETVITLPRRAAGDCRTNQLEGGRYVHQLYA